MDGEEALKALGLRNYEKQKRKIMDVSIVYLGNKLPKYLLMNLKYLQQEFPTIKLIFISDSDQSILKVAKLGIKTWKFNGLDENLYSLRKHLNHDWGFRNNFWFYTFARFFAIEEFMAINPNNRHLHVEADNLIFQNFPFDFFKKIENEIAFPMESSEAGAASVLFLKNHNAALKLRDFTINQINLNSNITDMTILGKTLEFEHIDTLVLGSVPANELDLVKDNFDCKLFCPDLGLKGFFDAMAHGQYLLGIDPRNSRGVLKLNFPSESSGAFSERINYAYVDGKVGTQVDKEFHQLYNIHNHAKDLRLFSEMKRDKLLRTRIAKSNRGKYYEFNLRIFVKMLLLSAKRRFLKAINSYNLGNTV